MAEKPHLEHRSIAVKGIRLHVVLAGPTDGPLVVLLHGFPEFWYGWRRQIGPLAAAGYRVAVPDQRGYNDSSKPLGLGAYTRQVLARDVVALMDRLGYDRATLVGHDWGGAVAWWTALQHGDRVERLVVLNIPHPVVFARALKTFKQARRSWYIAMFQLPWLPEWLLGRGDARALLGVLQSACRPGVLTEEDLSMYREAYLKPGAIPAMLAWYRAVARIPSEPLESRRVAAPTLIVWGRDDQALGEEMAEPSAELCDDARVVLIEGAGHFVALDAPERVNDLLVDFLGAPEALSPRLEVER